AILAAGLERLGFKVGQASCLSSSIPSDTDGRQAGRLPYFDTLRVELGRTRSDDLVRTAEAHRVNLRVIDANTLGIALDETVTEADLTALVRIFNGDRAPSFTVREVASSLVGDGPQPNAKERGLRTDLPGIPAELARRSSLLTHPVFNRYHSETEMLRYLKRLESRDLSLTTSMIPLGSCTMKLNATCEMLPVSWPEF